MTNKTSLNNQEKQMFRFKLCKKVRETIYPTHGRDFRAGGPKYTTYFSSRLK